MVRMRSSVWMVASTAFSLVRPIPSNQRIGSPKRKRIREPSVDHQKRKNRQKAQVSHLQRHPRASDHQLKGSRAPLPQQASIRVFERPVTDAQAPQEKCLTTFEPGLARFVRDDEVAGSLPRRPAAPGREASLQSQRIKPVYLPTKVCWVASLSTARIALGSPRPPSVQR